MANPPTAVIYFKRDSAEMAKDLAARVRNDGPKTLLIWAHKFTDEADVEETARAVIIQASAPNAKLIQTMYENFAAGVEIHHVDDEGEFADVDTEVLQEGGPSLDLQSESGTEPEDESDPEKPTADAPETGEESIGGPEPDDKPPETEKK